MKNSLIEKFILNPVGWLNESRNDDNILLSSRIRLVRNISKVNFPLNASLSEKRQVFESVFTAVKAADKDTDFEVIDINSLSDQDKTFLMERKLITGKLASEPEGGFLLVDDEETFQVMINEADHLKLQKLMSGNSLRIIWEKVNSIDNELSRTIPFAFDKTLGYITSSPFEVGTGMKASVMLNLPGLHLSNQIDAVVKGLNKLGLTVKGFYGENSSYVGNLYQISNQSTLGVQEEQIIEKIENIANQIVIYEKNARLSLLENKKNFLFNCIGRAYGTLRYSYILTIKEALDNLSILRMGVDLKMFSSIDYSVLNELIISIQNSHLKKYTGQSLGYAELDVLRADIVRNRLQS